MKNSFISILLFVFMLFGIFFLNNYMNSTCNNLVSTCENLEIYIHDDKWKISYDTCIDLYDKWQSNYKIISLYVNSNELDTLNTEIVKLSQYIETKTKDEALVSTHVIKFLIKDLQSIEQINLQNIF